MSRPAMPASPSSIAVPASGLPSRTATDLWGCPSCHAALTTGRGVLVCAGCAATYPMVGEVPVFVPGAEAQAVRHERESLLDSHVALELGCGHQALDDPNIVRTDVLLHPFADAVADVHTLPFQDASVDFVFSGAVFEHLRDPFLAAREIRRVLKPGGYVYADWNFVFAYHGIRITTSMRRSRAFARPSAFSRNCGQELPNDGPADVALRETIERLLTFPLAEVDTRMTTAAIERTAAGVYFSGIKQDAPGDSIFPTAVLDAYRASADLQARYPDVRDIGRPENLLRWAGTLGRASHPAVATALDALPRFAKHGERQHDGRHDGQTGREERRSWPVSLMSTPDLSDDDRQVLEMFRRRARPLGEKVRDVLRHDPLALPRKAARYLRWRWLHRRGQNL